MSPLGQSLIRRIARTGPINLADYMQTCLLDPDHGYYATRDPFGTAGDFITAPEISQMFGEMVGLWLAQTWMDQGAPSSFCLVELGPGRGTLMADILRATARVPGFHAAARVTLIEASATLRTVQRATLAGRDVLWLDDISALPQAPVFVIANEFFDALPIRQFQRAAGGWRERLIGLGDAPGTGETGDETGDGPRALAWGLGGPVAPESLSHRLRDTSDGDIVEICSAGAAIAAGLGHAIAREGGAALFVDYGGWHSLGDTFQALKAHAPVDPLAEPGEADLTAHVDFEALARAGEAAGARAAPLVSQGVFLERLGITQRARALAQKLSGNPLKEHIAAHRRLTHPDEMGQVFKTLALIPAGAALPPGFAS